MKKKLLYILDNWLKPYISSGDLKPILNGSADALQSVLKRLVKDNTLIRLKRDFYLITSKIQKKKTEAFEIAALLYGPSYISLESALSFHGWIPESVPVIISASSRRSNKFENFLGVFIYYHIPISVFHIGVSAIYNSDDKANIFIADPWKALADYIYIKKRSWPNIFALSNDLRIELDLIQNSDLNLLKTLSENYPNRRVQNVLKIILKDLIR
jgi:predicted transcriptional regulator of viral defense system